MEAAADADARAFGVRSCGRSMPLNQVSAPRRRRAPKAALGACSTMPGVPLAGALTCALLCCLPCLLCLLYSLPCPLLQPDALAWSSTRTYDVQHDPRAVPQWPASVYLADAPPRPLPRPLVLARLGLETLVPHFLGRRCRRLVTVRARRATTLLCLLTCCL